ncbi:MAG: S41 family peptidase [Candidatus Portnoybacteria bacterium CG10_big_fil_rev_8_21_14_0_10_36_7]|uniref:S41 family peptidase n=1 Tax=Candidatus Portnoybacteria bacterium CG10_big_fil_rev_8_21_14_0_10_36_7 TaxID=1974812 RepID=A0A2M8KE72_9BACT|nr:MAG: S41 family peptidase [Candidatus Portnoybacteria bacterium CG10_big_fil_rev_8_21_14_0_10_36_7]
MQILSIKSSRNYVVISIFLILFFGTGYYFGQRQPVPTIYNYNNETQAPATAINTASDKNNADFNIFWDAWKRLDQNYIDKSKLNAREMMYGAIKGLTQSLGDPYTTFMPPADNKRFSDDISGSFDGIGAEIGIRKNNLVIVAPLEGTPAKKAGIMAGDIITKIDDKSTIDMTIDEAVSLIRGKGNTVVTLAILREGWNSTKDFPITRNTIQIPIVKVDFKDGDIAILRLYHFTENSTFEFNKAIQQIVKAKVKGVILDLRNNPGGYLESSVEIASHFLDKNALVVKESYTDGREDQFVSKGYGEFANIPTVVLTNQGSASAAEILAGALRDQKNIKLIGEKTFGKGSVQQLFQLNDTSSLKITIAKWLTPSGKSISDEGLIPDIEVKLTDTDIEENNDPQIDKALEFIKTIVK